MIKLTTPTGYPCRVVLNHYQNGNLALSLVADVPGGVMELKGFPLMDGEPVATVSVNTLTLPEDHVAVKSYGENEGLLPALLDAGILEGKPLQRIVSGYVQIPVYRIGPAVRRELAEMAMQEAA